MLSDYTLFEKFPNLEELLLVEYHATSPTGASGIINDDMEPSYRSQVGTDLWGIIDVEMEDGLSVTHMDTHMDRIRVSNYNREDIMLYKWQTNTYGRDFFRVKEKCLEEVITKCIYECRRVVRVENGIVSIFQDALPMIKVRLVGVATIDEAQQVVDSRERYWYSQSSSSFLRLLICCLGRKFCCKRRKRTHSVRQ